LFSLYLCRYPNQNNFSKLKQFFINLISETCIIKETSEYELVRVHFLLSLCNFGEYLKVKSCYYVEVYAFKVFFTIISIKCANTAAKVMINIPNYCFTKNLFSIFFISRAN
jgi:hypothetical protein